MTDRSDAKARIEQLRETINRHDRLYFIENAPEISDAEYDRLFAELQELEDAHPDLVTLSSPTQRVGAEPVSELGKITHIEPMLSLHAVHDRADVAAFFDRLRARLDDRETGVLAEPKFDGVSIELVYENGAFARAATRGDGATGEDISHTLRTVRAVPLALKDTGKVPDVLACRGEAILPKPSFHEVNKARIEQGDAPFANPRNAAAGLLRRLDASAIEDIRFAVTVYDATGIDTDTAPTQRGLLDRLAELGLPVLGETRGCTSPDEAGTFRDSLADRRDDLEYEIDGIVLKLDCRADRDTLGTRSRSPRWAIAWKFPPRTEKTRIADIVISVGRTGALTPVALLDPVDIGGVTVARATLHNIDEAHRKDLRVGDTVRIERAGDVIPEVFERVPRPGVERSAPFEMPDRCPSCGAEVARRGPLAYCPAGIACPAQLKGRLVHYGSRDGLDIEGLGEKTADQLVARGLVADIADLYDLTAHDVARLDGFADPSASALRQAIHDRQDVPLDRFLGALGIRHVGSDAARRLARAFESLDALMQATDARIKDIDGIGKETARSVRDFFDEDRNRDVIARLRQAGVSPRPVAQAGRSLDGKTFVLTGKLDGWTRAEATDEIERRGGRVTSGVSGKTDYLVAGDDPGSKLDDARDAGVATLDEEAFKDMLQQGGRKHARTQQ